MSSLHNTAAGSANDATANIPTKSTTPSPSDLPADSASDMAAKIATTPNMPSPPDLAAVSTSDTTADPPTESTLPTSSSNSTTKDPPPYTATHTPHFLTLTLETRTKIHTHLLLTHPPISHPPPRSSFCAYDLLHWSKISPHELKHSPQRSGIPIAILLTNRQIHAKALPILYMNAFCIDLHPAAPVLTNDPRVVLGMVADWHLAHKVAIPRAWKVELITRLYLRVEVMSEMPLSRRGYLVLGLSQMAGLRKLHISLIYAGALRGFFVDGSLPVDEEVGQVLGVIYAGIPSWVEEVYFANENGVPFADVKTHWVEGCESRIEELERGERLPGEEWWGWPHMGVHRRWVMGYAGVDVLGEVVGNVRVPRGRDVEECGRRIEAAEGGPEIPEEGEEGRVKRLEEERREIGEAERYRFGAGVWGEGTEKAGLDRWWTVLVR